MEGDEIYSAAYRGSKQFKQQDVKTANATGFGAAADDYMERGIDLNEHLIRNKPATYFFRMKGRFFSTEKNWRRNIRIRLATCRKNAACIKK